jgi:hypothetical protein
MSRDHITHACGHEDECTVKGETEAERQEMIAWLKTQRCRACYRTQLLEQDAQLALPALTGSQKQVEWAISIRLRWLYKVKEAIEAAFCDADIGQVIERERDTLNEHTDARWWIDNDPGKQRRDCL